MLTELSKAGKKIKTTATLEEIEEEFLSLEIEKEESAPIEPVKPAAKPKGANAYDKVLASADPTMGDKCPTVVKWCKENLNAKDFQAKYGKRTVPLG